MVMFVSDQPAPTKIETPADAVKALRKIQQGARNWIRFESQGYPICHDRTFDVLINELECTIRNFERNIETDPEF